jgi:hypothetical protein
MGEMNGDIERSSAPPAPGSGPCGRPSAFSAPAGAGEMCYNGNRRAAPEARFPARRAGGNRQGCLVVETWRLLVK